MTNTITPGAKTFPDLLSAPISGSVAEPTSSPLWPARPYRLSINELPWETDPHVASEPPATNLLVCWKTLTGGAAQPSQTLTSGFCEVEAGGRLNAHSHEEDEIYFTTGGHG